MTELSDTSQSIKNRVKLDYLKGLGLTEIAKKFGYKDRSVIYYYLKPLTPEEKAEHTRNRFKNIEAGI